MLSIDMRRRVERMIFALNGGCGELSSYGRPLKGERERNSKEGRFGVV
jgi:hypothetical protein